MKLHELKIKEEYYDAIKLGLKTFELGNNYRDYQVGDLIEFKVIYDNGYIEKPDEVYKITYVLKDVPEYGLDRDYCILSIKKLVIKE